MARLVRHTARWLVIADDEGERALCAAGRARGGILTLDDAHYPVDGDSVVLPGTLAEDVAERLRRMVESAARSHAEALYRRSRLRSI